MFLLAMYESSYCSPAYQDFFVKVLDFAHLIGVPWYLVVLILHFPHDL